MKIWVGIQNSYEMRGNLLFCGMIRILIFLQVNARRPLNFHVNQANQESYFIRAELQWNLILNLTTLHWLDKSGILKTGAGT